MKKLPYDLVPGDPCYFVPPPGQVAIYALLDDEFNIRYVGKTSRRVGKRVQDEWHAAEIGSDKTYRGCWLRKLGHKPIVRIVGLATTEEWEELERAWIRDLRAEGVQLTNLANGGKGGGGWKHRPESLAAISAGVRGRKRPLAAIEATASAHRGRKRSPETGKRISEKKLGKPWTSAQREARAHLIQGETFCACGRGPFMGPWGLMQHKRQMLCS